MYYCTTLTVFHHPINYLTISNAEPCASLQGMPIVIRTGASIANAKPCASLQGLVTLSADLHAHMYEV